MDKELEALNELESYINNIIFVKDLINQKQQLLININTIKNALQELKAIKETESNEVLQCVDVLYANAIDLTTENTNYLPEYLKPIRDKVKNTLLKYEAEEKLFKHIRRNDMENVIPLSSIIGGLSQDDKHKFIEHIYYTWAELNEKYEKLNEEHRQALLKAQEDNKKAEALRELMLNHIEFVVEKDKCYFKIKNTKGKEKSFTSYTMLDFWKEVLK